MYRLGDEYANQSRFVGQSADQAMPQVVKVALQKGLFRGHGGPFDAWCGAHGDTVRHANGEDVTGVHKTANTHSVRSLRSGATVESQHAANSLWAPMAVVLNDVGVPELTTLSGNRIVVLTGTQAGGYETEGKRTEGDHLLLATERYSGC